MGAEYGIVMTINKYSQNKNEDGHTYSAPYYFIKKESNVWTALPKEPGPREMKLGDHYSFYVSDLAHEVDPKLGKFLLTVQFLEEREIEVRGTKVKTYAPAPPGARPAVPVKGSPFSDIATKDLGSGKLEAAQLTEKQPLIGIGSGSCYQACFGPFDFENYGTYLMNLYPGYKDEEDRIYKVDPHMDIDN